MIQFSFTSSSAYHELYTMNLHMLRAVLEMTEKKSAMYFSYFQLQKKKKKKKEHILFCAVQVVQKTLLGKTVSL